jgi:hypothetical protein
MVAPSRGQGFHAEAISEPRWRANATFLTVEISSSYEVKKAPVWGGFKSEEGRD